MKNIQIENLVSELVSMAINCNEMSENRCVYLTQDGKPNARARQIGLELYAIGSDKALNEASQHLAKKTKDLNFWAQSDCRQLDVCWDGIGNWRS